jgi:hypothetical protein
VEDEIQNIGDLVVLGVLQVCTFPSLSPVSPQSLTLLHSPSLTIVHPVISKLHSFDTGQKFLLSLSGRQKHWAVEDSDGVEKQPTLAHPGEIHGATLYQVRCKPNLA